MAWYKPLTLDGETLGVVSMEFNQMLRSTIAKMQDKRSEEAKLTLQLSVALEQNGSRVVGGKTETGYKPLFAYSIKSEIKETYKTDGAIVEDGYLHWDPIQCEFVIVPDGQMCLYGEDEEEGE